MTDPLSTRELHHGWTVEPLEGPVPDVVRDAGAIPATVPGSVHTDLIAAGLLADPYLGTDERLQHWVGSTAWRYRTTFAWRDEGADRVELAFHGLDTVATVRVNGRVVLSSENQHRSYRVEVRELLVHGDNELQVDFAAPVPEADRRSLELDYRPHVNHHPYNALRKMACSYGWDWGLDTATSGIWRAVRLESWSAARLAGLEVSPTLAGGVGRVRIRARVDAVAGAAATLTAGIGDATAEASVVDGCAELVLEVPEVELWWPRGYGAHPLYELGVELLVAGAVRDRVEHRIGFRTVELRTAPDASGTPFTIAVNGRSILVKGANWIPDDAFPHRVDQARYAQRIAQAAEANINLLRVWGGGIFESEGFYRIADESGMLVWQDFLLACAAYAEEAPLADEIEAEAREAVERLGRHPSLVLLNGNNENLQGYEEWGWQGRLQGRTWGARYYDELFPAIVAELAPHVPYTPGSPFTPGGGASANDPEHGSTHLWELWNRQDYPRYRDVRPRFVAEFGWQGPPAWATLTESMPDHPLTPESPSMLVHQKAQDGNAKLTDGLVVHLPLPNDMADWHWAMSLNQAVAVRTAVEWFRSLPGESADSDPHCMGAIVWQLNDCWPVVSWAAVDGRGRRKPLWHAIRRAFAPRLVTVQPDADGLVVALANDTDEVWSGELALQRLGFDGLAAAASSVPVEVAPRSVKRVPVSAEIATAEAALEEFVTATLGEERGTWFFAEAKDSRLGGAEWEASAERAGDTVDVRVTARRLVRDLTLLADVVDPNARAEEGLTTLLPGETVVIRVHGADPATEPERFLEPRALRSMNDLLDPVRTAVRA